MRCEFFSDVLGLSTSMTVILPESTTRQIGMSGERDSQPPPVLYLLHGLSDDDTTWSRRTSIERYAAGLGLAVVMPAVHHSFYTDEAHGLPFWTFLTEELPSVVQRFFRVSSAREDTFVAGLSMGGYGAMKIVLNYPQRFAAAASFSGALSLEILRLLAEDRRQPEFEYVFGDLSHLAGSEHDPALWLQRLAASGAAVPKLYVACGRQDDLYRLSLHFKALCNAHGIDVDYDEDDAGHEWPFWDRQIQRFLGRVLGGKV